MKRRKLKIIKIICIIYASLFIYKFVGAVSNNADPTESKIELVISALAPNQAYAEEKEEKNGEEEKEELDSIEADPKLSRQKPKKLIPLKRECSLVEIELLQTLAKRRKELEAWTKDAKNKEQILKVSENKINKKLEDLNTLKTELIKLLETYNEKENMKLQSLVKIYENMKPASAAKIFEKLDMRVLLQLIDRMKEKKVAPVLSKMNPARAKEITRLLAQQKSLPTPSQIK